ncbi:MAG: hypothetical protein KC496_05385, partial [Anaerolineae bacterium]|nr:hypothetical protein [Anaerolineae bacterium]
MHHEAKPIPPLAMQRALVLILIARPFMASGAAAQDKVEFLDGGELDGKILEIRKADKEFDFQFLQDGQEITKTYAYADVHAVLLGVRRFELTPRLASPPDAGEDTASEDARSKSEILKLIQTVGSTPPDWYEDVQVNYPDSLDLDWPMKAEGSWNNQKNVGQFIWDIVNPNPSRWQSGIKLVHQCMARHRNEPELLKRDMDKAATMYFTLLQDYARAAFWFQKSNATVNTGPGIRLAECYWRLGNKEMALEMMRGKLLHLNAVKLLGDMGEIDDALNVAKVYGKTQASNEAFLAAGDALRT